MADASQMYAKVGVGARVTLGRSNLLYSPSTRRPKCSTWELVFSNTLTISGHFTQSHTTAWQVSLLRLTLLDNTNKLFLTGRTVWNRVWKHRARGPI